MLKHNQQNLYFQNLHNKTYILFIDVLIDVVFAYIQTHILSNRRLYEIVFIINENDILGIKFASYCARRMSIAQKF